MLIVDTGPLVANLNRNDPDHVRCAELLESRTDDLLVTPYVVTETCYLVGKYVGAAAEINFVEALAAGDLVQIDMVTADLIPPPKPGRARWPGTSAAASGKPPG